MPIPPSYSSPARRYRRPSALIGMADCSTTISGISSLQIPMLVLRLISEGIDRIDIDDVDRAIENFRGRFPSSRFRKRRSLF
jgi:hypothetical protein